MALANCGRIQTSRLCEGPLGRPLFMLSQLDLRLLQPEALHETGVVGDTTFKPVLNVGQVVHEHVFGAIPLQDRESARLMFAVGGSNGPGVRADIGQVRSVRIVLELPHLFIQKFISR